MAGTGPTMNPSQVRRQEAEMMNRKGDGYTYSERGGVLYRTGPDGKTERAPTEGLIPDKAALALINPSLALSGESLKAAAGEPSAFDPVLDAAGLGVSEPGPPPDTDKYFGTAEKSAGEIYKEAIDASREAGAFKPTREIRDPLAVGGNTVTRPDIEALPERQAADSGEARGVTAERIARPDDVTIGPLRDVERVAGVDLPASKDVGPIGVKRAKSSDTAAQLLLDAALGKTPSKAEQQMWSGIDRATKQALGVAAGARGAERGGARREAMILGGQLGAEAVGKAAELRAGEMAESRGAYAQFTEQAAAREQQANNLEAQIETEIARGNQAEANRLKVEQGRLRQEAQALNAQATNTRTMTEAGLRADTSAGNAARGLQAALANQSSTLEAGKFTAGEGNRFALDTAGRKDKATEDNLTREANRRTELARLGLTAAEINAKLAQEAQTTNATNRINVDTKRADQEIEGERTRTSGQTGALNAATGAAGQQTEIGGKKLGADTERYKADKEAASNEKTARQAAGAGIATKLLTSDKRVKTGIKPAPVSAAKALFDVLMPKEFEYKNDPGTKHVGFIAQDLLKHPATKDFVHEGEDGILRVDQDSINNLMLAAALRATKGKELR